MRPMAWRRRGEAVARIPRRGELRIGIFWRFCVSRRKSRMYSLAPGVWMVGEKKRGVCFFWLLGMWEIILSLFFTPSDLEYLLFFFPVLLLPLLAQHLLLFSGLSIPNHLSNSPIV